MRRTFDEELALLPTTYEWALRADIGKLAEAIGMGSHLPLRSVGSGGSLSAAVFASQLHQAFNARVAAAVTPLEIKAHAAAARESASLFLSASGRNPDIIGAFRSVAELGASWISVVCMQQQSPLGSVAVPFPHVDLCEFDPPAGRDGFLATSSLLGLCVLLLRAFERLRGIDLGLPPALDSLLGSCALWEDICCGRSDPFAPLWDRATTIVLHGTSSQSAAADVESKLTEAALSSVQVSDYRNFAHGRHHWLAKRAAASGVLAMVTNDDREIAERTLRLIPSSVPVVRIDANKDGTVADLVLMTLGMYVTRSAGIARDIDPGRPQVPSFGRRLYHLNVFGRSVTQETRLPSTEAHAIECKAGKSIHLLEQTGELETWRRAHSCFVRRLHATLFMGLALDYDGTLCDRHERFDGIGSAVAVELERLLRHGVAVGIATGRGKSVRADLRAKLSPALWGKMAIGYYNCAEIGRLSDDSVPSVNQELQSSLLPLVEALLRRSDISTVAELTFRKYQITVEPKGFQPIPDLWEQVQEVVQGSRAEAVSVLRSSHSVDILAPGVSKLNLIERLLADALSPKGIEPAVLCIGDRGRWPGNDFELLSHPWSLSVDEVARDPETCWNLAPAGIHGAAAAVNYLRGIQVTDHGRCVVRLPRQATRALSLREAAE